MIRERYRKLMESDGLRRTVEASRTVLLDRLKREEERRIVRRRVWRAAFAACLYLVFIGTSALLALPTPVREEMPPEEPADPDRAYSLKEFSEAFRADLEEVKNTGRSQYVKLLSWQDTSDYLGGPFSGGTLTWEKLQTRDFSFLDGTVELRPGFVCITFDAENTVWRETTEVTIFTPDYDAARGPYWWDIFDIQEEIPPGTVFEDAISGPFTVEDDHVTPYIGEDGEVLFEIRYILAVDDLTGRRWQGYVMNDMPQRGILTERNRETDTEKRGGQS